VARGVLGAFADGLLEVMHRKPGWQLQSQSEVTAITMSSHEHASCKAQLTRDRSVPDVGNLAKD